MSCALFTGQNLSALENSRRQVFWLRDELNSSHVTSSFPAIIAIEPSDLNLELPHPILCCLRTRNSPLLAILCKYESFKIFLKPIQ